MFVVTDVDSVSLYFFKQLITGYNTQDATITSLLTTFDWYIVPVANPDGYEYSHTTGVSFSGCITSTLIVILADKVHSSLCILDREGRALTSVKRMNVIHKY